MPRLFRILFPIVAVLVLTGCTAAKTKGLLGRFMEPAPLRVGIAADSPPLAYKKDNALVGLETHFATGLAESVERKLELVELPREELAPALREKKIDIVMAGMTVAEAQKNRLATTTPYLLSGQTTLVRLSDYDRLGSGIRHLTEPSTRLGVVAEGAADVWLKGLRPKGAISRFASALEGVQALIKGTIDVFIYSLPANFYYAALYIDKGLTPGNIPLAREELAWAVRPDDDDLREAANSYLAAIEQSGALQKMLDRAIPFYRNTAYSPKL
jgi:polar amino acid transport system substrate-binding protein